MFNITDLQKPVLGLSPMDGITDSPFRYMIKKYGKADIMYTEFTHVHGLCVAAEGLLHHFVYDETQRPLIGQIYGKEPEYFYHAAKIICYLGFDGVDINMGCPAKTVATSGSGAGLIRTPDLAREIIAAVREGVKHWYEDGKFTGLSNRTLAALDTPEFNRHKDDERKLIPVSVKTRIGYDHPITAEWIDNLNQAKPDWMTVHGRTLKQMYTGEADWNELKIAVETANVPVLVNGDIKDQADFERIMNLTGAHGALIGRANYGTPWLFEEIRGKDTSEFETKEFRTNALLEHTQKFVEVFPEERAFVQMRKHFGWYCKGFDGASEMRMNLMKAKNIDEVKSILQS